MVHGRNHEEEGDTEFEGNEGMVLRSREGEKGKGRDSEARETFIAGSACSFAHDSIWIALRKGTVRNGTSGMSGGSGFSRPWPCFGWLELMGRIEDEAQRKGVRSGIEKQTVVWWRDDLKALVYLIGITKVGGGDWKKDRWSEQELVFKAGVSTIIPNYWRLRLLGCHLAGEVVVQMTSKTCSSLKFLCLRLDAVHRYIWKCFEIGTVNTVLKLYVYWSWALLWGSLMSVTHIRVFDLRHFLSLLLNFSSLFVFRTSSGIIYF